MSISYVQKNKNSVQTKRERFVSIIDSSSQSEALQRKADMANNAAQREEATRPNNTGMPDNLKSGIESLSGFSMDDVRVHYNSSKPATVQALAYTQGTDIHVAPGQEKHLPHEAWHVAQQMAGRVSPTTNINGMPVNDNAALEHEADVMGEKAIRQKNDKDRPIVSVNAISVVQGKFYIRKENGSYEFHRESEDEIDNDKYEHIGYKRHILFSYPVYRLQPLGLQQFIDRDVNNGEYDQYSKKEFSNTYKDIYKKILDMKKSISINDRIKQCFFSSQNIETIIGKFFSASTGANLRDALYRFEKIPNDVKENLYNSIKDRIKETLDDIVFWENNKNMDQIKEIYLTDSDVHNRGIGVSIVTYYDNEKREEKCVIKPEKKSLEKAIYGTGDSRTDDKSLAEKFGNIGTLDIQVSDNNGSCVDFFEHDDLKSMNKKNHPYFNTELNLYSNEEKIKDLIYFSSILGLRDLHHENLVYSKHEKEDDPAARNPQLIDAEIAMWYNDEETANPFLFSLDNGEMKGGSSIAKNHYEQLENNVESLKQLKIDKCLSLLETARTKLQGKTSRVVLIPTGNLYIFRNQAYFGKFNKNSMAKNSTYIDSIKKRLKDRMGQEINLSCDENHLIEETNNIFLKGQIPFYEYVFNTGVVYQKCNGLELIELYNSENLKLDNVINKRIERIINYVEDGLAKKQAYQQWEEQGKGVRTKEWTDANYYKALELIRRNLDEQAKVNAYYKWMEEGQPNSSQEEDSRRYFEGRNQALFDMCRRDD